MIFELCQLWSKFQCCLLRRELQIKNIVAVHKTRVLFAEICSLFGNKIVCNSKQNNVCTLLYSLACMQCTVHCNSFFTAVARMLVTDSDIVIKIYKILVYLMLNCRQNSSVMSEIQRYYNHRI